MSDKKTLEPGKPVPDSTDVSDHTTTWLRGDENLDYQFNKVPEDIDIIEISHGIIWARIPLPWSLDHINIYLLDEGDGWTIVDTGAQGNRGRAVWRRLEKKVLRGRPILNVVATHMHPDHLGLAGWLVKRHSAQFFCTMGEYLMAQNLWLGARPTMPEHDIEFLFKAGVSRKYEEAIRSAGYNHFKRGVHKLPAFYHRMEEGMVLRFGGRRWQVVIGRGHSPEHACLLCLDEPLFISGDQVLPNITSNVSVYAREPMGNPLAHWISSLNRLRAIGSDPVVLPSHGGVFKGLHARLDALVESHMRKLSGLHTHCINVCSPVETFPALFRRKVSGMEFFMALGEALAHLHLLESLDLLDRSFEGGVYRFQSKGIFDEQAVLQAIEALPGVVLRPLAGFIRT